MLEQHFSSVEHWLAYRAERTRFEEKIELLELQLQKEQEESERLMRWMGISTKLWQAGIVLLCLWFIFQNAWL